MSSQVIVVQSEADPNSEKGTWIQLNIPIDAYEWMRKLNLEGCPLSNARLL